jgi:nitrogen fixation/metabolism regulation signal transduction histidine kinase
LSPGCCCWSSAGSSPACSRGCGARRFGSRLLLKLAAIFALAGFVPGMLIYVVSYQFVSRSIESWFDVKVEGALDAGLNLGRVTLETLTNDLTNKARIATPQLSGVADAAATLPLERLRDQLGASDVVLFNGAGQRDHLGDAVALPAQHRAADAAAVSRARSARAIGWVEGLDEATPATVNDARVKALVSSPTRASSCRASRASCWSPRRCRRRWWTNALAVTQANREYQERALARGGLRACTSAR